MNGRRRKDPNAIHDRSSNPVKKLDEARSTHLKEGAAHGTSGTGAHDGNKKMKMQQRSGPEPEGGERRGRGNIDGDKARGHKTGPNAMHEHTGSS